MNLKELSKTLGLSQTTVSRALNGYPEVNEATRRRIEQAAIAHNYRPNRRATSLATGRSMTIGHVIPRSTQHEMVNPIFGDFVAGAVSTLAQNGYDMLFSQVADGDEEQAYRDLHSKAAVDGVIVQGPNFSDRRIAVLNEIGLPFVVHGRSSGVVDPYPWVDVNNRRSFQRATEFLCDLGHRRIGLINGLETMDFAQRRRQGFEETLSARGIPADASIMFSSEMTEDFGHQSTLQMLANDTPPTAILVSSLISAIGARRALEDTGLKLGVDVSIITHDDGLSYLQNGPEIPIFTATRSSVRQAGEILAQMLLERIEAPGNAPGSKLLEAELVVGRSTGPAP